MKATWTVETLDQFYKAWSLEGWYDAAQSAIKLYGKQQRKTFNEMPDKQYCTELTKEST